MPLFFLGCAIFLLILQRRLRTLRN
jgi:hypothetical protein